MRYPRLMLIIMAAVLCVAVSGFAHDGPGMKHGTLMMGQTIPTGYVDVHNTGKYVVNEVDYGSQLMVRITAGDPSWAVLNAQAWVSFDPVPTTKKGSPIPGQFNRIVELVDPLPEVIFTYDLEDDFDFHWGEHHPHELNVAVHADLVMVDENGVMVLDGDGDPIMEGAWSWVEDAEAFDRSWGWHYTFSPQHAMRGQLIDAPVKGVNYVTETHSGYTGDPAAGGFYFFPFEPISFYIGDVDVVVNPFYIGTAIAVKKLSLLDMRPGADLGDPWVTGAARTIQTLDSDNHDNGTIHIAPQIANCFANVANDMGFTADLFDQEQLVTDLLTATIAQCDQNLPELDLDLVDAPIEPAVAEANLEAGLNASGIFRKNVTKDPEWANTKIKLDVMPVYFPGTRSNGDPSFCDVNENGVLDEGEEGVPYEEWRLNGDPAGEECDPRVDGEACTVTLIECREVAKPLVETSIQTVDIFDEQVTTEFWPGRFAYDVHTSVSRDDGTTWKRKNVSRMADKSSFELESGEPFHGTCRGPVQKVNDNKILLVWTSTFCKSGNPRYAINLCDDPEIDGSPDEGTCDIYCSGPSDPSDPNYDPDKCEEDYPGDDTYYVTDIWGVRGQQRSVNYDEVDEVEDLGIGEIPYSCLWVNRGVIVTQADIDAETFASLDVDDPETPETEELEVGEIIWYKPERLTSGRRDAFFPVVGSGRGAGFAIAWQEDPDGLRPGKGKGPGQGWSGAITNHKTDIWYSFIRYDDFATVDEDFVPGGPPEDAGPEDTPGYGRPKALVPFSLPVRITDNDMVNTDTLKVELGSDLLPVIGPDGSFVPVDPLTVEHGNANGTKRYAYLAKTIDELDNATGLYVPGGDGTPDYQYFVDNGGTLDLCDTSGTNSVIESLPGTSDHERWYQFVNTEGSTKTVCVSSDGRLIDGDVFASRPNIQLQPYTRRLDDGTEVKSAWVLLAYEETKGMGHAHAEETDGGGQTPKPIKQDFGKNVLYHSFDYTEPELVSPGHQVNLPALCGGLYVNYCQDVLRWEEGTWDTSYDPICTCTPGQPIPLYFDELDLDGNYVLTTDFQQYRSEIARRVRFIAQSYGKLGDSRAAGVIIFKQGQEGQGRPADVFTRRFVVPAQKSSSNPTGFDPKVDNPFAFENLECTAYLDDFGVLGYNMNVWNEAYGDRLCGGVFTDPAGFDRRDQSNLTSADIVMAVDAGPEDTVGDPDDPTDDIYGTNKVLLWSYNDYNLGNESYGFVGELGEPCDVLNGAVCPGMYSNAKSHRGFIRGDFLVAAYAMTPNWAAARNGRDRYNFYIRKSFDGGQTWTTMPSDWNTDTIAAVGTAYCPEFRTDPTTHEPPVLDGFDPLCVDYCAPCTVTPDEPCDCVVTGEPIPAGEFEPAHKVSQFDNNKETSSDPRVGATPPVQPLYGDRYAADGISLQEACPKVGGVPICDFVEDNYVDNVFFVAWGSGDNLKSYGWTTITPEAPPKDIYYTRSEDYGDTFLKIPWPIGGGGNYAGEVVWRHDFLAHGEPEEQGECQLRATPDGSKLHAIWHSAIAEETDPDEEETRWYPWEPEVTFENDVWYRRIIFWSDELLEQINSP